MLLPPYIFPSVSWFIAGVKSNEFRVGLGGNYEKQTQRNRYTIAGPNNLQNLTVPIVHTGIRKIFTESQIAYEENWSRLHLSALKTVYGKAPFFEFYDYKILPIISSEEMLLSSISVASIKALHAYLCPEIPLIFTQDFCIELPLVEVPTYPQVFDDKWGFRGDVSALDLLFNMGPEAEEYLFHSKK